MKIKKLNESIYKTPVTLIWDCKAFEAENYLKESGISHKVDLVRCSGQTGRYSIKSIKNQSEKIYYYIFLEKGEEHKALLHEVAHLVFMSLADCGILVDERTDEIYAYYLEHWYKKLFDCIK